MKKTVDVTKQVKESYDEQYAEDMSAWRELGAKYKFRNILQMCKNKYNNVLECGAGDGSILKFLNDSTRFEKLSAIEISKSGVSKIKKRKLSKLKEVKLFDGYKIPYKNNEFDLVICSHVLEHVEHPRLLIRELIRVSKQQIFEIPLDYSTNIDKKMKYFLDYGHINIYTPSLFKFLLKSEGLGVMNEVHCRPANEVLYYDWVINKKKNKLVVKIILILYPLLKLIQRVIYGEAKNKELNYNSYTCLTKPNKQIKIFER